MNCLANDFVEVFRSPSPADIYTATPAICVLPNGRLIASLDLAGPGTSKLPEAFLHDNGRNHILCKVLLSDDGGKSWRQVANLPYLHARPFVAGNKVYIIGHRGSLGIVCSQDMGESWGVPCPLTQDGLWHQSACNVLYKDGFVYLVMETTDAPKGADMGWPVCHLRPILLRGREDSDLTQRESWTFAHAPTFREVVQEEELDYFGLPFFDAQDSYRDVGGGRGCAPMGWLETNVAQITDPNHYWYDPKGKTIHLMMRAHTGMTNHCCIMKVVEQEDGSMETVCQTTPSGRKLLLMPLPGGQMRFHILFDAQTQLYWLLSTQATDSMTRVELLPPDRYNLPDNERQRMVLHFSKNLVDWCFAGLVAVGPTQRQARHYASMAIQGEDLVIVSRSGDQDACSAHNGNIITFHRVENFRKLVY